MFYRITPAEPILKPTDFVSMDTLKPWLRVGDTEDDFLKQLLPAAMQQVEDICDQPIFERNYTVTLSGLSVGAFPVLAMPTTSTITATYTRTGYADPITILDSELVLSGSRLSFASSLTSVSDITGVTLTVKLGYSAEMLPENIKFAVCYIVSQLYDNRNDGPDTFRKTSERLLTKYIRYGS